MSGVIIETCSAVLDVQDMKLSQVTREFLTLVKGIAAIDKDQYPETLGKLFIINVPSVFPLVWRTVQFFLDPATAAKIEIYGAKKDWLPALTAQIGLENMPSTYGGLLPALSSEVHPYAETMMRYERKKEKAADGNDNDKESPSNGDMNEEKGEEHDDFIPGGDEIDMYIRRGQLATEALRLQGLSVTPPTDSWKTQPLKMIMSAFSPQKEQSSSHGITDVDSIAIDLSPAMSQAKNAEDDEGKERSVSSRAGSKRWSREFQYSHGYEMNSPSSQLDELEAPNTYNVQGEDEMENLDRRPWSGIWGCKTLNRIPGVSKLFRFLLAAFRFLTLERWVSKMSLKQIRKYLFYAVSGYMLAALTAMVVSAYLVSETLWSSSVAVYVHLWTGVVVLLVSVVMMTINLAAYIGCYYQNRALLVMYAGIVGAGSFVFCVVAIASFLYASYPSVSNAGSVLDATFKERNSGD
jgi:CRAL/TRIO domain